MKKIGLTLAGLALAAAPVVTATAASASVSAPDHACKVTVGNLIQEGHGGWYRAKILGACKNVGVQPEAKCVNIKNDNSYPKGKVIYRKGVTSKVTCGTTLVIKEAWVIIGGHRQEVWPHHA